MKNFFKKVQLGKDDNGNFIINKEGITLIALVITIVVLIILVSVIMGMVIGQNGIINRAKQAKIDYETAANSEAAQIAKAENLVSGREETQALANPTGTIIAFAADNPPTGYLACNGQEVSRTTYSALFSVIGTKYGAGDGSTTFKVPDLRGEFLRGTGTNTTTRHSGESVGVHQNEGLPNISGTLGDVESNSASGAFSRTTGTVHVGTGNGASTFGTITFSASNSNAIYGASSHVTPTNTSVLYCIKF